jgi:hypothetical protein
MKLDTADLMRLLRGILADLKKMKVWPVAAALVIALVAVPVLLSRSSTSTPVAQVPQGTPPPANAIPAISVQSTPVQSKLSGHGRNPFSSGAGSASTTTTSSTTTAASGATGTSSTGGTSAGSSAGGSASTGTPTSSSTAPTTSIPSTTSKPAPAGLTATQAYDVALAITNSSGGFDTTDPLQRLSVLPSDKQPLLIELGVKDGGHSVLFAVQPRTVVNGPGTCTPGPIDCEILSLPQGQTEGVSTESLAGNVVHVADFSVTAITAKDYPSAAAADSARRTVSKAGRELLNSSTLSALSLFKYEPSLGALVDQRNLTVAGGS